MKHVFLLTAAAVFSCACATGSKKFDFISTGPRFPETRKVEYFTSRPQVKKQFATLGTFHSEHYKMGDRDAYRKQVETILKEMAKIGADAVIASRGYSETGYYDSMGKPKMEEYVSGYAIKYIENFPKDNKGEIIIPAWDKDIDDLYEDEPFTYEVTTGQIKQNQGAPPAGF